MTGTQLLVLALLVASFGAGWFARGGGTHPAEELGPLFEDGRRALDAALEAAEDGDAVELDAAARRLRETRRQLADALGSGHPLVEDVEHTRDALTLVSGMIDAHTAEDVMPLVRVVRDARARYQRGVKAITGLPG